MTKIKAIIIKTLKEFEQQDYKRGGTSIAPEMYNAIADKLYSRLLSENKDSFTGYEYDKKLLMDYGVKIQEYLLKPPFNLEHSQHGIACEKLADVRENFLDERGDCQCGSNTIDKDSIPTY